MKQMNSAEFRHAASRFTTGVAVLTARDQAQEIVGMTANSFMSVSLAPPTVLVSVMDGRTLSAIEQSGKFAINVLPAAAKDISSHFSGRQVPGLRPGFEKTSGMPKLEAAIAYFECDIEKFINVADHTLLIGKVVDCSYKNEEPLVFFSSQYHNLGGEMYSKGNN
tara:strand:+ start:25271 stop:25765 length:495 start_codon:yes stop_codon:yes gene_type:complete